MCILLMAVGEAPQAIEALFPYPVLQKPEIRVRLPGVSHDQRGADSHARDLHPELLQQAVGLLHGGPAPHAFKDGIRYMLQRDVDIVTDLGLLPHHFEHIHGKPCGECVMQADPLDAFHLAKGIQQVGKGPPPIQVQSVVGQVLGDQNEFTHPL